MVESTCWIYAAVRPNLQGCYHYGMINTTRTIRLQNSAPVINCKHRYAVNSVSFIPADNPLKLADYFKISGVVSLHSITTVPLVLVLTSKLLSWQPTLEMYPNSWTAVYMPLDDVGMWNVRSENWARQYLGQQFYLRVYSPANSWRDEYPIPSNALLCG
ncbi:L-ascorbate oxidase homolog isoform X2 [Tripterygium wilfordii]|uniref:L-ascorbate oxidase homolog isoform X2 n=1 Tax=Tripterygium wilfordii TaxID=458696 RepID=UPI0018F829E6|nr:L-ascorbate oxidase homolog isoform X2 [Tripterygium wilfordii]XP_038713120.1 L-ascorbate oxidase homolog isoform X2 [Tripterygium wilfordii]